RLYTVSDDGHLRSYDRSFRLIKKVATRGGKQPFSVAVDPSGQQLAVGFDDTTKVDVFRAADLSFAFEADTNGVGNGDLSGGSWSADGRRLLAGGRYWDGSARSIAIWPQAGRGPRRLQPVAQNTVMQIVPCGSGFAVGATDPLYALLDADGRPRL